MNLYDCIYSPHCTYTQCDMACPVHAEVTYWMERCGITMDNYALHASADNIQKFRNLLESGTGKINAIKAEKTVLAADLLSYCAICMYGHGTALSGGVYNLNYSEYIEEIKHSWNTREEDELLQFMKIWSSAANYLIISHLDYINFKDFESQTLLGLLQSREGAKKSTFIVIPKSSNLIGSGSFYNILCDKIGGIELK